MDNVPYERASFLNCFLILHTYCMWKQPLAGHVTEAEGGSHRPLPPQVGGDGPDCSGTNRGCNSINQLINQSTNQPIRLRGVRIKDKS